MFRFEELEIWRLAIDYGSDLYDIADGLPQKELYGLGSQLRRAAVSISNNIAEGSGASTGRDFRSFFWIPVLRAYNRMNACLYCHPFGRLRAGSEQSEGSGLRMKSFLYGPDSSLHYAPLRMTLSHSVRRSKSALETVNILYFALLRGYISKQQRPKLYEEAEKLIRKIRAFKKTLR